MTFLSLQSKKTRFFLVLNDPPHVEKELYANNGKENDKYKGQILQAQTLFVGCRSSLKLNENQAFFSNGFMLDQMVSNRNFVPCITGTKSIFLCSLNGMLSFYALCARYIFFRKL